MVRLDGTAGNEISSFETPKVCSELEGSKKVLTLAPSFAVVVVQRLKGAGLKIWGPWAQSLPGTGLLLFTISSFLSNSPSSQCRVSSRGHLKEVNHY